MMNFKHWSLKWKIATIIVATFLVISSMTTAFSSYNQRNLVIAEVEEVIAKSTEDNHHVLDEFITGILENLSDVSTLIKRISFKGTLELNTSKTENIGGTDLPSLYLNGSTVTNQFLDELTKDNEDSDFTIFVLKNGNFYRSLTTIKKENGDRALGTPLKQSSPAYQRILNGQAYEGSTNIFGRPYLAHYSPLLDSNGELIGAFFMGRNIAHKVEELSDSLRKRGLLAHGYIYIVDGEGNFITHPSKEYVDYSDGKIHGENLRIAGNNNGNSEGDKMLNNITTTPRGELFEYQWKGVCKVASSIAYEKLNWYLVGTTFCSDVTDEVLETIIVPIISSIVTLLLVSFVVVLYLGRALNPISTVLARLKNLSNGDLTGELLPVNGNDEVGQISKAINLMTENLRNMVIAISSSSQEVSTLSDDMKNFSEQSTGAISTQDDNVNSVSAAMEEMSASAGQIAEGAETAGTLSTNALNSTQDGRVSVDNTTSEVGAVIAKIRDSEAIISQLDSSSQEVSSVLQIINEIAEQTNLLALNAAIEAARAGEAGRGFAVVADEVRNLASKTKQSTEQIQSSIVELTSGVESTSVTFGSIKDGVESILSNVELISKSFGNIEQEISINADSATQTATAAQEQQHVVQEVAQSVTVIRDLSVDNTKLISNISKKAEELNSSAQSLQEIVNKFRV